MNTLFYYLFGMASVSYILHLGFYLINASLYDIWQQHRIRQLYKKHLLTSYQPYVTVLVPAHNEEKVVIRCLNSIFQSTYEKIDVIVVNDASTDATRALLNHYKHTHPQINLRVIHKRKNVGKGAALNYALRRYCHHELVMMLDADSIISPQAIERAVTYFINPKIAGVAANVQIMNEHTTLSILQKFEHMVGYRAKKAYSLTNCEYVIGGVASTYRLNILRSVGYYDTDTMTEDISLSMKVVKQGNLQHRIVYGADVMAMTEPVESMRALFRQRFRWKYGSLQNIIKHKDLIGKSSSNYSAMLTLYRLPMAIVTEFALLFLPLLWFYTIYLTLTQNSLLLIFGAYITVTIYMFLTLWHDEHLRFTERLYLTIYIPVAYFIFYIMDIIQIVAINKCLTKLHHLNQRKDVSSTWVSPTRIGGRLQLTSAADISARRSLPLGERAHE